MPHAPPGETKRSRVTGGGARPIGKRCSSFWSSENLIFGVSRSLWEGVKQTKQGGVPDLDNQETAESSGLNLLDSGALTPGR